MATLHLTYAHIVLLLSVPFHFSLSTQIPQRQEGPISIKTCLILIEFSQISFAKQKKKTTNHLVTQPLN